MMHQTLDELIAVRHALLASDDASLEQLRQVDRRLVSRAELGDPSCAVPRVLSGESLVSLASMPARDATLWLEIAITLDGIRARPALDALACSESGKALCWWLAAHYPGLTLPGGFPETPELQVLAARARWRRGQAAALPAPWKAWAAILDGHGQPSRELVGALWSLLPEGAESTGLASWKDWFYPIMVNAHDDSQPWLVNWLLAQTEPPAIVEAMGVTCARRFLSWLDAIGAAAGVDGEDAAANAAHRELRWLRGDNPSRSPAPASFGYQCWGEVLADGHGLEPVSWQGRFSSLPLGYRERCWYWSPRHIQGGPWSLFGGQWCAGS